MEEQTTKVHAVVRHSLVAKDVNTVSGHVTYSLCMYSLVYTV